MLDGAKGVRDGAIAALLRNLTAAQIQRLNVSDVRDGLVVFDSRVIQLEHDQCDALNRWLRIRPMVSCDCDALFVSLHWTNARKQPGGRISYDGLRRSVNVRAVRRSH